MSSDSLSIISYSFLASSLLVASVVAGLAVSLLVVCSLATCKVDVGRTDSFGARLVRWGFWLWMALCVWWLPWAMLLVIEAVTRFDFWPPLSQNSYRHLDRPVHTTSDAPQQPGGPE